MTSPQQDPDRKQPKRPGQQRPPREEPTTPPDQPSNPPPREPEPTPPPQYAQTIRTLADELIERCCGTHSLGLIYHFLRSAETEASARLEFELFFIRLFFRRTARGSAAVDSRGDRRHDTRRGHRSCRSPCTINSSDTGSYRLTSSWGHTNRSLKWTGIALRAIGSR